MIVARALDHLVMTVRDVDATALWYGRALGMAREDHSHPSSASPRTSLRFGDQKINLRPCGVSEAEWFTGAAPASGTQDLCFLVEARPAQVADHLTALGVEIILGPISKRGAIGEIMSVYCRDPDGNLVEISSYA